MRSRYITWAILGLTFFISAMVLYGCASNQDSTRGRNPSANVDRAAIHGRQSSANAAQPPGSFGASAAEPVASVVDARPAAMIDGRVVSWGELRPILNELAGADALRELLVDRRLNDELQRRGMTLTEDDVALERKTLIESLHRDPDTAVRLLDELRERQKLGRVRFEALMRRNAALRALVRDDVQINDEAVGMMHERLHGPKRQARLIIVPDLRAAESARSRIRSSGESFSDVAVDVSTDSSAPRGGLLEPISRVDPAYPESLRRTLFALRVGDLSGPILLEDRYALLQVLNETPGDGTDLRTARPALERAVRIAQERLLMDQLARRLMSEHSVTVFDEQLHDSWRRKRGG